METHKGHLTHQERQIVYLMHEEGQKDSAIGKVLGRDRSVIWRERKRNSPPVMIAARVTPLERAKWAQDKAKRRRSDCKKGQRGPLKLCAIRDHVNWRLEKCHYSPERIADEIDRGDFGVTICGKTIRRWLASEARHLLKELPDRGKPRRKRVTKRRSCRKKGAVNKRSIYERTDLAEFRLQAGHYEADAIVCKQSTTAIISVRERKTRRRWFRRVPNLKAETVRKALIGIFRDIPPPLRLSCTYDNGSEFAEFNAVEMALGLVAYFCDPYCSWQKGAVEHQNKEFRRFVPKGSDLSTVSDEEVARIEKILNDKPMLCLGKLSAEQAWIQALREARIMLH